MTVSPNGPSGRVRRTQKERREETIAKLLDASADAIHDLGYSGTTVQEICTRAGLSQGALFRHFPTRKAVLVATARRISENHVAAFASRFGSIDATPESLVEALRQVRDVARSPANLVWLELIGAARTDVELRDELAIALASASTRHAKAAEAFVGETLVDHESLLSILRITLAYFDAEADLAMITPNAERDERDLQMLAQLLLTQYPGATGS